MDVIPHDASLRAMAESASEEAGAIEFIEQLHRDVRNTIFGDEDVPRTRIRAPRLPHDERRLFEHGGRLRGRRRLQS